MRRIVSFLVTSVDGYDQGLDGELDWPVVDDEFTELSVRQLSGADILMLGRVTYEGMAGYWPTPAAQDEAPKIAPLMNDLPKIVVSRTLATAEWPATTIMRDPVAEDLAGRKDEAGRDILVLGSSSLTLSLIELGLLDELRLLVTPIALGAGRSVLRGADGRIGLHLLTAEPLRSGAVLLSYSPML